MGVVLIHNIAHNSEGEARAANRTRADVTSESYWNLWKAAQPPFQVIQDGVDVLLLESWPGGGVISWHVRAQDVVATRVADKAEAVDRIAKHKGETAEWVLGNDYTYDRPDDISVLIFWNARPIKRLDMDRPDGLKIGRNGWLVTDAETLAAMGVQLKKSQSKPAGGKGKTGKEPAGHAGRGRRLDVEARKVVEKHAEDLAYAWCHQQSWSGVKRVGSTKSWDLEGVDDKGKKRQVEVKGTTGGLKDVEVTAGEVKAAKSHGNSHLMVIVHGIELSFDGKSWNAAAGSLCVFDPWKPKNAELSATRYRWKTKRQGTTG